MKLYLKGSNLESLVFVGNLRRGESMSAFN